MAARVKATPGIHRCPAPMYSGGSFYPQISMRTARLAGVTPTTSMAYPPGRRNSAKLTTSLSLSQDKTTRSSTTLARRTTEATERLRAPMRVHGRKWSIMLTEWNKEHAEQQRTTSTIEFCGYEPTKSNRPNRYQSISHADRSLARARTTEHMIEPSNSAQRRSNTAGPACSGNTGGTQARNPTRSSTSPRRRGPLTWPQVHRAGQSVGPGYYKLTSPRPQGTLCNIFSRPTTATGPVLAWACISITWKELPTNFFRKKMSGSRDRKIPLENAFFFAARGDDPLKDKSRGDSRAQRKFWPWGHL